MRAYRYVHSGIEPLLIAGHATAMLIGKQQVHQLAISGKSPARESHRS